MTRSVWCQGSAATVWTDKAFISMQEMRVPFHVMQTMRSVQTSVRMGIILETSTFPSALPPALPVPLH